MTATALQVEFLGHLVGLAVFGVVALAVAVAVFWALQRYF